jgi:hypothetical protein
MNNRNYKEKTERLGDVKSRQVMWLWEKETAHLSDDDMVVTVTEVTPFGNYLLSIQSAN